jgi:glycosyltransferase involved in cell wall biosynthesis
LLIPHPTVEVMLPVHNEAESIAATVKEIYDEVSPHLALQFIITEDGSRDNTKEVLTRLSQQYPMKLMMSEQRKGYGGAIVDAMPQLEAEYFWHLDSDGQMDPKDFWKFWEVRENFDVLIGWRVNRRDRFWRRLFSAMFYGFYQLLFWAPAHDPSCSFILARREVVERLVHEMGEMNEGLWWEFIARAHRRGLRVGEIPINHRLRSAGRSRVYHLKNLPRIASRHFLALFKIWAQTRS